MAKRADEKLPEWAKKIALEEFLKRLRKPGDDTYGAHKGLRLVAEMADEIFDLDTYGMGSAEYVFVVNGQRLWWAFRFDWTEESLKVLPKLLGAEKWAILVGEHENSWSGTQGRDGDAPWPDVEPSEVKFGHRKFKRDGYEDRNLDAGCIHLSVGHTTRECNTARRKDEWSWTLELRVPGPAEWEDSHESRKAHRDPVEAQREALAFVEGMLKDALEKIRTERWKEHVRSNDGGGDLTRTVESRP
jgi:hypothetical protein